MQDLLIHPSWAVPLLPFFKSEKWKMIKSFLENEHQKNTIYPPQEKIFNAFKVTPFEKVSVVILGQDPYHGVGQAEGLSFSVAPGVKVLPSLSNIYKEIESDLGIKKDFSSGSLVSWGEQGVLLLNAVLTVRAGSPASHGGAGWESFTDDVIQTLSKEKENLVFILWGNFAKSKRSLIDEKKHLVLGAAHPSPFSSYSGFFGCRHFSQTNEYLKKHGKKEIQW